MKIVSTQNCVCLCTLTAHPCMLMACPCTPMAHSCTLMHTHGMLMHAHGTLISAHGHLWHAHPHTLSLTAYSKKYHKCCYCLLNTQIFLLLFVHPNFNTIHSSDQVYEISFNASCRKLWGLFLRG